MSAGYAYPFWLGGIAASMAACCTHPLDLMKVRMQTLAANRPSSIVVVQTAIAESGIRSLYTGLTASLLRQMSYSLVRLGSYEEIKQRITKDHSPSSVELLIAACIAGGLGGIIGNPSDILLVRMTSDSIRPPEKRYHYPNAINGLTNLIKDEGLRGLTRGLATNTTRAILMNASQVGSYDYIKSVALRHPVPVVGYQFHDNILLHLIASCLAGTIATTICSPADVLKSRVMSSSCDTGILAILTRSLREEGFMFLFKGWVPAFTRLGPNTVLLFVFFEQLKKGWKATTSSS